MTKLKTANKFLAGMMLTAAAFASTSALADDPKVKFTTTEGEFVIELYPEKAPNTVKNFLDYVKDKHYNGTIFHRVIKGFMVQGGGFDTKYNQKETKPAIKHEGHEALEKGLTNSKIGSVAMARTGNPNSATSQFFINVVANEALDPILLPKGDSEKVTFKYMGQEHKDIPRKNVVNHPQYWGYTVFGQVISGMDTVEKIRNAETGKGGPFSSDAPQKMIEIKSAEIIK